MTYMIYNMDQLSYDQVQKYSLDIQHAMQKLANKYADDICLDLLIEEIVAGKRSLWLILKGEEFAAFLTSAIEINSLGKKTLKILELAGEGGPALAEIYYKLEEYAMVNNIDNIVVEGRFGWRRILEKYGYLPYLIHYRKEVNPNVKRS